MINPEAVTGENVSGVARNRYSHHMDDGLIIIWAMISNG